MDLQKDPEAPATQSLLSLLLLRWHPTNNQEADLAGQSFPRSNRQPDFGCLEFLYSADHT